MRTVIRLVSVATLFSLVGVFVVVGLSTSMTGHSGHTSHHTMAGGSDCPFMHHGENLCPMTALDHLAAIRTIFESALPSLVALILVIGSTWAATFILGRQRPLTLLQAHTFLRWRQTVTYSFVYRFYQSLLARGIMQPKVFA